MITKMHIENFRCFKDFGVDLGPFNVLIGPNDSGKTAFLQAIRVTLTGISNLRSGLLSIGVVPEDAPWRKNREAPMAFELHAAPLNAPSDCRLINLSGRLSKGHFDITESPCSDVAHKSNKNSQPAKNWRAEAIGRADYYRFNPSDLRKPSLLDRKFSETGEGLPTFMAEIILKHRKEFGELEKSFCARFPYYEAIVIDKTTKAVIHEYQHNAPIERIIKDAFTLQFRTVNKETISAESVSDGVMISLGYLALIAGPNPPGVLLIEEPENGVHHGSLKEIVGTLRKLQVEKGVQVIMTTHSPFLLDLVEPAEVQVFCKNDEGAVHARRLSEFSDAEKLKKHFMTGEIWTEFTEEQIVFGKDAGK